MDINWLDETEKYVRRGLEHLKLPVITSTEHESDNEAYVILDGLGVQILAGGDGLLEKSQTVLRLAGFHHGPTQCVTDICVFRGELVGSPGQLHRPRLTHVDLQQGGIRANLGCSVPDKTYCCSPLCPTADNTA